MSGFTAMLLVPPASFIIVRAEEEAGGHAGSIVLANTLVRAQLIVCFLHPFPSTVSSRCNNERRGVKRQRILCHCVSPYRYNNRALQGTEAYSVIFYEVHNFKMVLFI